MRMTSRERWLALLNRQKPDRIPTDYWATPEVSERLQKELGCSDLEALYRKLHIDRPQFIGAKPTLHHYAGDPERNIWGIRTRKIHYEGGSYEEFADHLLAGARSVEEIHAYHWPHADDHDWEDFSRQVQDIKGDRLVSCGGYEPFLLYCALRGMEQAMMDLLSEPEIADAILGHIFNYFYQLNERMWDIAQGRVDLTYLAEDLGSQTGLLMGLKEIHRYILPNQKRMADLARSHGIHIFYHTDGAAREVIPDLIRVTGIEILNPIQWRCPGMEREKLVRDFGDQVIFHGAIDNQQTLAFGKPEDVRGEVLENIAIFSKARWICAPCHNLQPVSPTANIVALYETVRKYGQL